MVIGLLRGIGLVEVNFLLWIMLVIVMGLMVILIFVELLCIVMMWLIF